jgi:hypothetical protein
MTFFYVLSHRAINIVNLLAITALSAAGILLLTSTDALAQNASTDAAISTYMPNAKLVIHTETGSSVDLAAVATEFGGTSDGSYAVWTKSLNSYDQGDYWSTFPAITLHMAVGAGGTMLVGASGSDEAVLSVLTEGGASSSMSSTWGHSMTAQAPIVHPLLTDDIRSTVLTSILYEELISMNEAGAVSGGPSLVYSSFGLQYGSALLGFLDLPFALKNRMGADIDILASSIYARQSNTSWACGCPFDGTRFDNGPRWPMHAALNQAWNPKTQDTDDGSASRQFDLSMTGDAMFYSARSDGDNSNSGSVTLDGNVVTSFSNWDPSSNAFREGGNSISSVNLNVTNNWSVGPTYDLPS